MARQAKLKHGTRTDSTETPRLSPAPWEDVETTINGAIKENIAMQIDEIIATLTWPRDTIKKAVHQMDDNGDIIERNGYYVLSEREKRP